jgi:hypothetical protein
MDQIVHDTDLKDTVTPLDNDLKTNEELTKVWEESMHDFVPEDFMTFEIPEG